MDGELRLDVYAAVDLVHRTLHTRGLYDGIGLHRYLDHPDVATLAAPDCALFIESCLRDHLFMRKGMEDANEKIRSVYSGLKHPERYQRRFYDAPRRFTVLMQDDAFA